MRLCRRAVLLTLPALVAGRVAAAPSAVETARIERLLQFVEAQRQMRFIRNGSAYSSKEAAQFLRAKYARMGEHVTTAAEFIEQIAARSSTSGEAYLMRLPDGRTVPVAQVLSDELGRIDRRP